MDLNYIYRVQVPVDGTMHYVKRILDQKGNVLWQVHACDVNFRDNIPVNVSYDINPPQQSTQLLAMTSLYLVAYGDIRLEDTAIKGFSSSSYARTPICIDWTSSNQFTLVLKIKTGTNMSGLQTLFSVNTIDAAMSNAEITLEIRSRKLHWKQTNRYNASGTKLLEANSTYFVKIVKDCQQTDISISEDGSTYVHDISVSCYAYDSLKTYVKNGAYEKNGYCLSSYSGSQYIYYKPKNLVDNYYLYFGISIDHSDLNRTAVKPFLGEVDLSQSTLAYDGKTYMLAMHDDSYVTLDRDGAIKVTGTSSQIISGFSSSSYVHTGIFVNWSTSNETTVVLKITTGSDVTSRQELFGMQSTDNFELEIYNKKLHWELADAWSRNTLLPNQTYIITFQKIKTKYTVEAMQVNNDGSQTLAANVNASSSRTCYGQHLYIGVDKQSNGIEPFKGVVHCNGSYLVYNNKKYKFKI